MVLRKDLENINAIASDPQIIRAIANEEKATVRAKLAELYTIAGSDYEGLTIFNKDGTIYSDGVDPKREGISIKDKPITGMRETAMVVYIRSCYPRRPALRSSSSAHR